MVSLSLELWKLKREFWRAYSSTKVLSALLLDVGRRKSLAKNPQVTISDGQLPCGKKIVLFLVFQPDELPKSILATCTFLSEAGYAPLIVANGGLSQSGRDALLPFVWKVLERPNFGHDFGGYREGILWLAENRFDVSNLLVLNDSIWFPLFRSSRTLRALEASAASVTGLVHSTKSKGEVALQDDEKGFLESYLFHVDGAMMSQERFLSYWTNLRISNNKNLTVKVGEKGFSRFLIDAGVPIGALSSRAMFLERIKEQDNAFLYKALKYSAYTDDDVYTDIDALLAVFTTNIDWKNQALAFIEKSVRVRRFHLSFFFACTKLFDLNYVKKKQNHPQLSKCREALADAIAQGDLDVPEPAVFREFNKITIQPSGGRTKAPASPSIS